MGQSNERGDGGIYIGSIMKGGAVAADGRIEPGDMLLQVRTGWRRVHDRNLTQTLVVSVQISVSFHRWMTSTLRTCATTMPYECWERSCISLGESYYKTFMLYGMCLAYQQKCVNSCTNFFFCRPVSLTVAKCWDPNPNSCFALPRSECSFFPSHTLIYTYMQHKINYHQQSE